MPIFFLPQLVRYEKLRPARAHHEIGSAVERRLFSEKGMTNLKSNLTIVSMITRAFHLGCGTSVYYTTIPGMVLLAFHVP